MKRELITVRYQTGEQFDTDLEKMVGEGWHPIQINFSFSFRGVVTFERCRKPWWKRIKLPTIKFKTNGKTKK